MDLARWFCWAGLHSERGIVVGWFSEMTITLGSADVGLLLHYLLVCLAGPFSLSTLCSATSFGCSVLIGGALL